jgi:CRISPR-associated protein Csd1
VTILQALDGYYARMAARGEADEPGWSREKFGWCVVIDADGAPVDVLNLHDLGGKKPVPKLYRVPAGVKRTVGIATNFLWDKTAYSLGRTAGEGRRTAQEHAAFVALHLRLLAGSNDEGLVAFARFLASWTPERFDTAPFLAEMLDSNILFRLAGDRCYLHERDAARALVGAAEPDDEGPGKDDILCLVTGQTAPQARLHPTIKGVEGGQTSGASLVSFNLDAFTSYGKEQGANAPTSQAAAFRYGSVLNRLLLRGGPNRVSRPIGDATVVFWADATNASPEAATALESLFGSALSMDVEDAGEAAKIGDTLEAVAKGRPLSTIHPDLVEGVRFHVLGLAPNAARLSVRYWLCDDFRVFAERLAQHSADLGLKPSPWVKPPSVNRFLVKTVALQEKFENIPPLLAGEVMRAILSGGRYPQSLLAAVIIRLRAGDDPLTGWHAAVIRAVLARDFRQGYQKEDTPVSLVRDEPNRAYQLGRLFAVLETAQRMALGRVNASIRDRYFGAASAAPAGVFPLLLRGAQNHLGKLRKEGKGGWIEREIEEILGRLTLDLPRALPLAEQGRFAIGYYHQRKEQFAGRPEEAAALEEPKEDETND